MTFGKTFAQGIENRRWRIAKYRGDGTRKGLHKMSFVLIPNSAFWRTVLDKVFNNSIREDLWYGAMYSDGLHRWYGEGVDWANNWVNESKQEFTDALSCNSVKCQCRTAIAVPKGKPVRIGDVVFRVCKEVFLLTTFTALAK